MKNYNYDRFNPKDYNFSSMSGPKVGEKMIDSEFTTLDGNKVSLLDYIGKKIVIETGSTTCPMYVKNIKRMNELALEYSDVIFLVVYVREAHPGEKLSGHKSLEGKVSEARKLLIIEKEGRIILVDNLSGTFHNYAGSLPEMLYILDENMKVILRSSWADPMLVECTLDGKLTVEQQKDEIREPTKPDPITMFRATLRGGILGSWDLIKSIPRLLLMHARNGEKKVHGC